jgi:hypothetical protein
MPIVYLVAKPHTKGEPYDRGRLFGQTAMVLAAGGECVADMAAGSAGVVRRRRRRRSACR